MIDLLIILLLLVLFVAIIFGGIIAVGSAMGAVSKYRSEVEKEELAEYCDLELEEQEKEQSDVSAQGSTKQSFE